MAGRSFRRVAVLAVAGMLAAAVEVSSLDHQTDEIDLWDPTRLTRWMDIVERHVPGADDEPLREGARWTADDLRQLWVDIQVLWLLVDTPAIKRGELGDVRVRKLDFAIRPTSIKVEIGRAGNAALRALATRVDKAGASATLRRGILVHTDVALVVPALIDTSGPPVDAGAPQVVYIGDGQHSGAEAVTLHWTLARMLIEQLRPAPSQDPWARDWYRAVLGVYQRTESFDSVVLRPALRLFPDDPQILFLAGCHREAMASALFQEFARPYRALRAGTRTIGAMRPDIASRGNELRAAERHFRDALRHDPTFIEARIRLGRVLSERGRHNDAASELRAALDAPLEPMLEYYAALYLGAALDRRGDANDAVEAYTRAADLAPEAPVPQLALARLAQLRGDRQSQLAHLARAVAPADEAHDPWWFYRSSQVRDAGAWLDDVRRSWNREPR